MRRIPRKCRSRCKYLFYIYLVVQLIFFLYPLGLMTSTGFKGNEFHSFAAHTFKKPVSSEPIAYPVTDRNTTKKTAVYSTAAVKTTKKTIVYPTAAVETTKKTPVYTTAAAKTTKKTPVYPTTAVKTKKRPVIDMVNDYYPFVDFKFVFPHIMPEFEQIQALFLIVLVNSGAKGDKFRRRRAAIRETWASHKSCEQSRASKDPKFRDLQWILVFVVGKAGPGTRDDEQNVEEAKQHNDMLIGSIHDNYLNNIVKLYMGQLWASTLRPKYILKTDDDVYVRIPGVIRYLVKEKFPKPFYGGETYVGNRVFRSIPGKWSISKKYFDEFKWPPYNAGSFFILSADLLNKLFHYVHRRKPFHTDDSYVGVAMRDFNVKVTHILSFDIKNDMPELIRKKNDCETLALVAFGHNVDPESSKILHGRLESICRNGTTITSC